MAEVAMRSWCGLIEFSGKQPVLYGTTVIRREAPQHEVEAALTTDISRHLPDGWRLLNMIPGAIHFSPEEA